MLKPLIAPNNKLANIFIGTVSVIVFVAVAVLTKTKLDVDLGFDIFVFAKINAVVNTLVSICLIAALVFVKQKKYEAHRNVMFAAIGLSVLFLLSYIAHHLFAGETKFGGEGLIRPIYYFILITHIVLAGIILPFILYTAYRGLTGEYAQHKKLAKYTWPLWLYVSVTGVIIYVLISPYYVQ